MRSISVSTGVFARIWAARRTGEETEDAILNRLLPGEPGVKERSGPSPPARDDNRLAQSKEGFRDRRFGVLFPEGFEIFRTYLGTHFRARAANGHWVLTHNGQECDSLNELSSTIGARTENAWVNWMYRTSSGGARPISELRDPSKIVRRKRAA